MAETHRPSRRPPLPYPLPALAYLATLSDDVGVIQHAAEDIPNRATGYCTDDVSRAFMVAIACLNVRHTNARYANPGDAATAERLASTYLSFLHNAQSTDGRFHNFMGYDRTWLDAVGSQDCNGRAIWAIGYGMRYAQRESWNRLCASMLRKALESIDWLAYPHSKAYAAIGLAHAYASCKEANDLRDRIAAALERFAADLSSANEKTRGANWEWFEDDMTYDSARLCEALLRAGTALEKSGTPEGKKFIEVGLRTFAFYTKTTIENGMYIPIGNNGWYRRGGNRARYAQQPLEAASLIDAAYAAYEITGDPAHDAVAQLGLEWYYGRNSRTTQMAQGGGCYDGLGEDGPNRNMGAESTLAYLASSYTVAAHHPAPVLKIVQNL
jgi:hypothetical protein